MSISKSILSLSALFFICLGTLSCGAKDNKAPVKAGKTVIELFTSEGCSSCPKADKTVAELQERYKDTLLVLCYHVDYWNYLGWKDMFSSPANTNRQHYYTDNIFHLNSPYTPEAVINGKQECVGSDKVKLEAAIHAAPYTNSPAVLTARQTGNVILISLHAGRDKAAILYLVQKEAITQVGKGENSGMQLRHINIVKEFVSLPPAFSSTSFTVPASQKKEDYFVAALIQDSRSGAISDWTIAEIQ